MPRYSIAISQYIIVVNQYNIYYTCMMMCVIKLDLGMSWGMYWHNNISASHCLTA